MRRLLVVACAVVSLVGLAVSSGAFTSAQADRSASIDIAGDGNAYMALDDEHPVEPDGTVGETVTLPIVNVTNQFTETVDITVSYTVDGPSGSETAGENGPTALAVGETTGVSTEVTCPSDPGEYVVSVDFDATAEGSGVFAETSDPRTVTYEVDCTAI